MTESPIARRMMPPPVASPRTPRLRLPEGSVDCHMHLFGPYDRYPVDPDSRYVTADCLAEEYIGMMDRFGIARAVFVPASPHGTDPTHLLDILAAFPDRFLGVAILGPDAGRDDVVHLALAGVKGARFQSPAHGSKLPSLSIETAEMIHDFGWHVELYPSGTEIVDLEPLVERLPNKLVFDHFGSMPADGGLDQPAFKALLRLLDTGRVWVKLSRPQQISAQRIPWADAAVFARALVRHAPERVLWGTDWPHVGETAETMPDDGDLVDLLLDWAPDERARHRLLVENPRDFYELGDGT
jgi:2-pyrone-4,6-dicarboxylate lactonase